jgi:hypothetical protein
MLETNHPEEIIRVKREVSRDLEAVAVVARLERERRTPAVRKKVFSYRQFMNTLLHEFMHHWDFHALKLARSFHTRGFFLRVDDLFRRLVDGLGAQPAG